MARLTTPTGAVQLPHRNVNDISYALFDLAVAQAVADRVKVPEPSPLATPYYHGTSGDWAGLPSPIPYGDHIYANFTKSWPPAIFASPDIRNALLLGRYKGTGRSRKEERVYETHLSPDQIYGSAGHPPLPPGQDERDLIYPLGWGRLLDKLTPYFDPEEDGWDEWDVWEAIEAYLEDHPEEEENLPSEWYAHIEMAEKYGDDKSSFVDALEEYWSDIAPKYVESEKMGFHTGDTLGGWHFSTAVDWARDAVNSGEWARDPRHVALNPPEHPMEWEEDKGEILILNPLGVRWTDIHADFIPDPDNYVESIRDIRDMRGLRGNEWLRRIVDRVDDQADRLVNQDMTARDWRALRRRRWGRLRDMPQPYPSVSPVTTIKDALGFYPNRIVKASGDADR